MENTIPYNHKSIYAFIAALLAVVFLCVGILPIPFLEWICYPSGFMLGVAAVVLGLWAQAEVHARGGSGKQLAVIAVWSGVLTIVALICIVAFLATVIPRLYGIIVDFLNQYDLNPF